MLPKASFFVSAGDIKDDIKENAKKKYGFEASIPIFNAASYVNILSARKHKELKDHQLQNVMKSTINDLSYALVKYKGARNSLDMHKISEDYHYKTLSSAREELNMGSINISQIIEIQKNYNESSINRLEKEKEYFISIFEIFKITEDLLLYIFCLLYTSPSPRDA